MKTVFSNSEIVHEWAYADETRTGRTPNGSMRFSGNVFKSYSTVIAVKLRAHNTIIFTDYKYSPTTTNHLSIVVRAIPPQYTKICVPFPIDNLVYSDGLFHDDALLTIRHSIEAQLDVNLLIKFSRARLKEEFYRNNIAPWINAYDKIKELLHQETNEAFDVWLQEWRELLNSPDIKAVVEKQKAAVEAKKEQEKKIAAFKRWKRTRLFLANKLTNRGYGAIDCIKFDADKDAFITAQGINIPRRVFTRLYQRFFAGDILVNDKILDTYNVNYIGDDFFVVGCHRLSIKHLRRLALKYPFLTEDQKAGVA